MKKSNLKKLRRNEQKQINGGGPIRKCSVQAQCWPGECCDGGMCIMSPIIECRPEIE